MRLILIAGLLAGCDRVFGLEQVADSEIHHDEDGDGIDDSVDKCPTIAAPGDQVDSDGDGIGDLCDLGSEEDDAVFVTFAFGEDPRVVVLGASTLGVDELALGTDDVRVPQPIYLANVMTDRARVDIGFEITGPPVQTEFHEVAITTVNLGTAATDRGDTCYIGYDVVGPYVERVENDAGFLQNHFSSGTLVGKQITWSGIRTPDQMTCNATIDGSDHESIALDPVKLKQSGKVGIWTDGAVANIHYLWIVTPRP